jgi:RNA polymerase sigma factor (sigma-70 family)
MDDRTLIDKFVKDGSETAFAELTSRYAGQVYCAARRQIGDADKAKDVAQTVFILLARKASSLSHRAVLAAWLFRATRLVASNMRKYEARRQQRENKAATMTDDANSAGNEPQWGQIQPYLDDSIARLSETERTAVLLSFFHKLSQKETGERLGLSEEAVRKRIRRALEKMRAYFHKRGITVSGELLMGIMIAHSAEGAPMEITAALSVCAAKSAIGVAEPVRIAVEESLRQMFWVNIKGVAPYAAAALMVLGIAGWWFWNRAPVGIRYSGMSDASAAVWAGEGLFLVADDEVNHLNLYSTAQASAPLQSFDFGALLQLDKEKDETDWEGATRIGNRSYWITSHGQNRQGKTRSSRHRLMAVDILWHEGRLELSCVGKPYTELAADLAGHPDYQAFNLRDAARRAPKAPNALNIEGLCATPDGRLLIGFRNPVPQGKALVARLLNPADMVAGERARLAPPLLLDLGGLGVRDIARLGSKYYIIAGPVAAKGGFAIFEWDENGGPPKRREEFRFGALTPEALLIRSDGSENWFVFLSDDGTLARFGQTMKETSLEKRQFRVLKTPFK